MKFSPTFNNKEQSLSNHYLKGNILRIIAIRHGQSEANVKDFGNIKPEHDLDPVLTELGKQQAQHLSNYLIDIGIHKFVDQIHVSPLTRAVQTLNPYLKALQNKCRIKIKYYRHLMEHNRHKDITVLDPITNKKILYPSKTDKEFVEDVEKYFNLLIKNAEDYYQKFNKPMTVMIFGHYLMISRLMFGIFDHTIDFQISSSNCGISVLDINKTPDGIYKRIYRPEAVGHLYQTSGHHTPLTNRFSSNFMIQVVFFIVSILITLSCFQ